jgi:hypothetical protein
MARGQRAGRAAGGDRRTVQHPRAQRRRQRSEVLRRQGSTPSTGPFGFHFRQQVQEVGIGAQLSRGPGQRLGDARAQRRFQHRHDLVPDTGAGEPGAGVVRVVPDRQVQGCARGPRRGPPYVQERAAVAVAAGGHPGQCPGTRPTRQPEQNRLRLIIKGVAEQDRGRAGALGQGRQGVIAGRASGRLRAAMFPVSRHADGDALHWVEPEPDERGGHVTSAVGRAGLQPMVDGDAAGAQPLARRDEGEGGRERKRVGAAGAGR